MSASKIDIWIKAGYKILGTQEEIKVERLARLLSLNKSGFYYYFGTMESFLKSLLNYHEQLAEEVADEIAGCETIDPDLLLLIVRHRSFFLVESQIVVKGKLNNTGLPVSGASKIVNHQLMLLWQRYNGVQEDYQVNPAYVNIIQSFIYARIDENNISYKLLLDLLAETKRAFEKVST
jgi:AcrR family transcriptional regulator